MSKSPQKSRGTALRCLIVERHNWETGGGQQQLQFVLAPAAQFFGPGTVDLPIAIRVFLPAQSSMPAFTTTATISREYGNGTRRVNGFPHLGGIPSSFVFFEETSTRHEYNFWWQEDKAIIAAKYSDWEQGHNTQYGRGRLSLIVEAPVNPRVIDHIA